MITIPIATHCDLFKWQLDLFWFSHWRMYGQDALNRAHAAIIRRNEPGEARSRDLQWSIGVPHTMCESFFDLRILDFSRVALPINIQAALAQILPFLHDDQMIEVIDCDMIHFRRCPALWLPHDELLVSAIYEYWHLHSLTTNRHVIAPYFENGGGYYNGGFVPIIGRAGTFKRLLHEWTAIHIDILRRPYEEPIHWWAGMFALQAACEKARVLMRSENICYIPGANMLAAEHYIGHYSVDPIFNKQRFPAVDRRMFESNNPFYELIEAWLTARTH